MSKTSEPPFPLQQSSRPHAAEDKALAPYESRGQPPAERPAREREHRQTLPDLLIRSPRDYLIMLRERWYFGVLAALLVSSLIIYNEATKPEVFRTQASLLFEMRSSSIIPVREVADSNYSKSGGINTHIEQIKSTRFFEYLRTFFTDEEIERIQGPYQDPDEPDAPPPSLASIIRPNLDLGIRRNTTIVEVIMRHRDPEIAKLIANRIANKYIDFTTDITQTTTTAAIVELQRQKEEFAEDLGETQERLRQFRAQQNIANLGNDSNVIDRRVGALSSELINAESQRRNFESQLAKVEEYRESGDPEDLLDIPAISQHESIPGLIQQLDSLRTQRALLSQRYLEKHPNMIQNEKQAESIRELLNENIEEAVTDLKTRYRLATEHEENVSKDLAQAENAAIELDQIKAEYDALVRDLASARESLEKVRQRLDDARIASQLNKSTISIFDEAPYGGRTEPDVKKAVIQAALLGFVLLIGVPIGIGVIDFRLKTSWEVEDFLNTTLAGEICRIRGVKKKRRPHIVSEESKQNICEGFRGIYSRLEIGSEVIYPKVILISSTLPNEGKSVITANLASTFAMHGRRTLMVDADLRRPSLNGFHDLENNAGLLKWIRGREPVPEEPLKDETLGIVQVEENLSLLRSGGSEKRPTRYFENERLNALFARLRDNFDVIIVDSPPMGVFSDSLLLSRYCDEILFVVRFNKTGKFRIRATVDRIYQSDIAMAGVVLNGIPPGNSSSYYGYRGYGTYSDEQYAAYERQREEKA